MTDDPAPPDLLDAPLRDAGFERTDGPPGAGFGDRVVAFARGPVSVCCVRDRGRWSVEVGRAEWGDLFELDVWSAWLTGTPPPPLEQEAPEPTRVLLAHLDAIAAAGDEALEALRSIRAERARRWLGSLPDGS